MRILIGILLFFNLNFIQAQTEVEQFEITITTEIIQEQLIKSFSEKQCGMLIWMCNDSLDFAVETSEGIAADKETRRHAMNNIQGLMDQILYSRFKASIGKLQMGYDVVSVQIYKYPDKDEISINIYFVIDECKKITAILIE